MDKPGVVFDVCAFGFGLIGERLSVIVVSDNRIFECFAFANGLAAGCEHWVVWFAYSGSATFDRCFSWPDPVLARIFASRGGSF